jgi:hypothetical protein
LAILDRFRSMWNAFVSDVPIDSTPFSSTASYSYGGPSPMRTRRLLYSERSLVSSIYTIISNDVADIIFKHIKLDDQGRYLSDLDSPLTNCLQLEPNLDQGPRAFRQDIASTLFDDGVAAIVPVDTSTNPNISDLFDIYSLRVGKIVAWFPRHVRVSLWNEAIGKRQEVTLEKRFIAIVENPFYEIMNSPNSTLQRLSRKLSQLDAVDEVSSSGKLDIIMQLPYQVRSEARKEQANARRNEIELQLKGSQYGIAWADATEKITQLNRPAENNLWNQVQELTKMLYEELGLTPEVMNGSADEAAMINYFNRTVKPIVDVIVEAMQRAFLGPQGTNDGQRIKYFRDPFKLVPVAQMADIADKFTRNEILTSNEMRGFIGIAPSSDPKADRLENSNNIIRPDVTSQGPTTSERNSQNGS